MKIRIRTIHGNTLGELNDSKTSQAIFMKLPIKGQAQLWGEEIYFEIPLFENLENEFAKQDMDIGDLAYWESGNAFCIFFGKTPNSINGRPKAVSHITFLGKINDVNPLKKVRESESIILERA